MSFLICYNNINMDKQDYLNEISNSTRPATVSSTPKIFSSKFFWVGIIGVILFILIAIVGSVIGGSKNYVKDNLFSLILHINYTTDVIKEYQPHVKSSDLRSYSESLNNILSGDISNLTTYAKDKYDYSTKSIKESVQEEEQIYKDTLLSDLFNAKITGSLDFVYAQKLATDISLIQSREAQIIKTASDSNLRDTLNTSYDSLTVLYDKFNSFSEFK